MWRFVCVVLLVAVLLGIAPVARGQEMEARFYLIPTELLNINGRLINGPRYVNDMAVNTSILNYGAINLALVAVYGDEADLDWLASQVDVYAIPSELDVNVPQVSVQSLSVYLESHGTPGDWTSPSLTWRETLRTVSGMYLYMQRLCSIAGNESPLDWGYTLNTQWQNVSGEHQTAIIVAASSMGYDTSFIRDNTLIRAILKTLSDAWGEAPIHFTFMVL